MNLALPAAVGAVQLWCHANWFSCHQRFSARPQKPVSENIYYSCSNLQPLKSGFCLVTKWHKVRQHNIIWSPYGEKPVDSREPCES
jgi:hypothetical protein